MRVLVADDDEAALDTLSEVLCQRGYDIVATQSGTAAWELLQRDDGFSLAVLNCKMRGLDGIEVCRKVRLAGRSDVYILMLTEKSEVGEGAARIDAGANDYLRKPADAEELCTRLRAGERILRRHEELRLQASRDRLTGVLNRETILRLLEKELRYGEEMNEPTSVILVNIDACSPINDENDSIVGHAVLREVSSRLERAVRGCDAVGRYGIQEFLVILPGCRRADAAGVAERLRVASAGVSIDTSRGVVPATISVGICASDDSERPSIGRLIRTAEQACRRDREQRRNCAEAAR